MKQITEDYVSYEIAKLLKEKGFEQIGCKKRYNLQGDLVSGFAYGPVAPSQSLTLKWLREVHNICITIDGYPTIDCNFEFKPRIFNSTGKYWEDWHLSYKVWFTSYEEACEAAIKYTLENLI